MGSGGSVSHGIPGEERPMNTDVKVCISDGVQDQAGERKRKRKTPVNPRWGRAISKPVIPKKSKNEIFKSDNFDNLDHFASREMVSMDNMQGSYEALAIYLTKNASTDLARVRVIFRWLASVNLQSLVQEAGNELPPQESPLEGLLEIHWGLGNHAHLFARLARTVGLDCEIISGINKNANYKVGQPLEEDLLAAQWNAVSIDGDTYLLDVYWASTYVDNTTTTDWLHLWNLFTESDDRIDSLEQTVETHLKTKHRINEFFFLTDPHKFIVTHFPEEEQWQLLENPLTMTQFAKQVYVRERFYDMNLTLDVNTSNSCVMKTTDGQVTFAMQAPMNDIPAMVFRWKLMQVDGNVSERCVTYDRYVFVQKKGANVEFWIVLPKPGNFQFDLYGQLGSGERYDRVCSLLIECDVPSDTAEPLPDLPDAGWGLCPIAVTHELTPRFDAIPYMETNGGCFDLEFTAPESKTVGYTLRHNTIDDVVLRRHALVTRIGEKVTINIRFPCKGSYALGLYIGESKEDEMFNAANFMINCVSTGITPRPYPMLYSGRLGGDLMAKVLGIEADSHADDFMIRSEDGILQVTFKIENPSAVDLLCELQNNDIDSGKLSSYVAVSTEGAWTHLDIQLPVQGEYGLNIFVRKMGVDFQIFHVFSYLVVAQAGTGCPIKVPDDNIAMETIFTADDITDIRVGQSKGALLSVSKKNSQNHLIENQITAKKEGDITVYEVDLPTIGEYVAAVYKLKKNGLLVAQQVAQLVRLEPLQGDRRSFAMMFPDRRLNKVERKRRKSMALGLNHEAFRQQLRAAVASQNISLLQWAIGQCEINYIPERNGELHKSKKILDFLMVTQNLSIAVQTRDLNKLKRSMESAKNKGFAKILSLKLAMAQRIADSLLHMESIKNELEGSDRKQIMIEMRQYESPPEDLMMVLVATCDLLGLDAKQLKDWEVLQTVLKQKGKNSLKKMVLGCSIDRVDIVAALRTKRSLQEVTLEEVKTKSACAALFYLWCNSVVEEVESSFIQKGGDLKQATSLAMKSEFQRRDSAKSKDDDQCPADFHSGFALSPIKEEKYGTKVTADPNLTEL